MSTYKQSGVDLYTAQKIPKEVSKIVKNHPKGVLSSIGGFSALFELDLSRYKNPVLVSSTDGVGTKLKIAFESGEHWQVGIDLVAMSVNDILTSGAEPLFFMDYMAQSRIDISIFQELIQGINQGCQQAGIPLIGGETAEMPEMYSKGEYDLAGFVVGVVEKQNILNGSNIQKEDLILGLPSSGFHSNGYSLLRSILFKENHFRLTDSIPELPEPFYQKTLKEILLTPTIIYKSWIQELNKTVSIKGLAHITGGGLKENIERILPPHTTQNSKEKKLKIELLDRDIPPLFRWIQKLGSVQDEEMKRVFNLGIGMAVIVSKSDAEIVLEKEFSFLSSPSSLSIGYPMNRSIEVLGKIIDE